MTTPTTRTTDLKIPYSSCVLERRPDPCAIIIVGASGDLTSRKLIPSLFNLYTNGGLPEPFFIVGCARSRFESSDFREKVKEDALKGSPADASRLADFLGYLHYHVIDYEESASFDRLSEFLRSLEMRYPVAGNRIFYFAIPPTLYESTARMLGSSGLAAEREDGSGWVRIVVEKPFGRDLDTAIALDTTLHAHFQEHQIFRIDHYLAKETVQNILMFRFANAIFEPVWNRRYVSHIRIMAAETLGVEHRVGYYEGTGVLRDMFQNHMMQLLALTALEPPSRFEAERVRDEKTKTYRALRPFPVGRLNDALVLGQYGAGRINGKEVPAYREEPKVDPESLTPTFASMRVFLDNWRWQGVPFYLTSGKRLPEKRTEITIHFKEVPHSMFRDTLGEHIPANQLTLGIYPDEKIYMTFQTKNPGARVCLRSVTMDFNYHQDYSGPVLDAYEKVLLDCMLGDQMLFWRQDGVELCWSFLTPILRECESCGDRAKNLLPYASGTWGPEAP
ncbi:MAG: glucose-6-phosphate dehydrogenase [Deltaproteobacteria bacterium]|nr:glucose-6-phosphate dehydrogenase [Deltaproteobacteria bacterium]